MADQALEICDKKYVKPLISVMFLTLKPTDSRRFETSILSNSISVLESKKFTILLYILDVIPCPFWDFLSVKHPIKLVFGDKP
jgi:hypothetical protein